MKTPLLPPEDLYENLDDYEIFDFSSQDWLKGKMNKIAEMIQQDKHPQSIRDIEDEENENIENSN